MEAVQSVRYVEFFGLPGVGKSTLRKKIKKYWNRCTLDFVPRATKGFEIDLNDGKRHHILQLAQHFEAAVRFPFGLVAFVGPWSSFLELVSGVPRTGRNREILLKLWVKRLRRKFFSRFLPFWVPPFVDEGLLQTALSAIIRVPSEERDYDRIGDLLRDIFKLYSDQDHVVYLNAGPTEIRARLTKTAHKALNADTQEVAEFIARIAKDEIDNFTVVNAEFSAEATIQSILEIFRPRHHLHR